MVIQTFHLFGSVLGWLFGTALAAYIAVQVWTWTKASRKRRVPMAAPRDVAQALSTGAAVIYDVRSHGYYDSDATRIQGSTRIDPNLIHQAKIENPEGKQVYLYCTCLREATSSRIADELQQQGISAVVIEGGLRAWRKAGLPLERVPSEEVTALPVFES